MSDRNISSVLDSSSVFFFSSRRRHTRLQGDWSSDVCSSDLVRLDKDNAAVLLVDHQTGLLSLVRDIDPDKFKNNVLALADIASYFKLPTILTTSFENGPNGPLVPELKSQFPQAPYIARPGNINAWDNEDFVKAVKATGTKQLIIAGVVTEVCVAFPALSAIEEGFDVFRSEEHTS